MKLILSLLLSCVLLSCRSTDESVPPVSLNTRATVSGHVEGGAGKFVSLLYLPRLRGSLNPDGYRTQGVRLGADGHFSFTVDKVTEGGNYGLNLEHGFVSLVLSAGDELYLDLAPESLNEVVIATGQGAGKINFQRLDQFEYDYGYIMAAETPEEFAARADSIVAGQVRMLEAVYAGDPDSEVVTSAVNWEDLQTLITKTPLTAGEYHYLDQLLHFGRYSMTLNWLSEMAENPEVASLPVDFDGEAFDPFNAENYSRLKQMNDYRLANGLDAVVRIEHLKEVSGRKDSLVTYGNWRSHLLPDFDEWKSSYLQDNFNDTIYNAYYGSLAGWMQTMGQDYRPYSQKLDTAAGGAYFERLVEFNRLTDLGTRREKGFEADSLTLDKLELQALLDRYAGKELLVNFWSAEFAGSSIVDNIPLMQDFERQNRGEITVVNICIDSLRQKGLWAARIMDSRWGEANHYFVPIEGSEGLLNAFSARNLATFCEGGATYSLVDVEGNIHRDIDLPFHKLAKQIARETGE